MVERFHLCNFLAFVINLWLVVITVTEIGLSTLFYTNYFKDKKAEVSKFSAATH